MLESPLARSMVQDGRHADTRVTTRRLLALLLLLTVIAAGSALRFHALGRHDAWGDEGISWAVHQSESALTTSRTQAYGEPPLFHVLLAVTTSREAPLQTLRRFPAACSALALITWVALLWRMGGIRAAVLGAPLYAFSSFQVFYAQELRAYSLLGLLGLVVLWPFLELLRFGRLPAWGWGVLAVAEALLLYSHYLAAFFLIGLSAATVILPSLRRFWRPWLASQVAGALLVIPWMAIMASCYREVRGSPSVIDVQVVRDIAAPTVILFLGKTIIPAAEDGLRTLATGAIGVAALFLLSSIIGGLLTLRRRGRVDMFAFLLFASVLPIAVLVAFSLAAVPTFSYVRTKHAIWAYAPLAFASVLWLQDEWERGRKRLVLAAITLFLAINGWGLWNYFTQPEYLKAPAYREMASRLGSEARPGDAVLYDWLGTCEAADPVLCSDPRLRALQRGLLDRLSAEGPRGRFGSTGLVARRAAPESCAAPRTWILLYHDWRRRGEPGFAGFRGRLLREMGDLERDGHCVRTGGFEVVGLDVVCLEWKR